MSEPIYEPKVRYTPGQPQPSSSGLLRTLLMLGCAVIFLCCFSIFGIGAGITALAATTEANEQTKTVTETLSIEDIENINLVVENEVGKVTVNGSRTAENIEVTLKMRATGVSESRAKEKLENLDYAVEFDDDEYIIKVENDSDESFFNFGDATVDVIITLPESINLSITNNVGKIDIRNVIIRDQLDLTVDVGEVRFEGQVGPQGEHRIEANVGDITVQVTRDSRFALDARTDVGEISTDLTLENKDENWETVSQHLTGLYGADDPEATLTIVSDVGAIEIRD